MKAIQFKITALCICLFMVSYNSFSQKKKTTATPASYTIEGSITGLTDGTTVKLIPGATPLAEKPVAVTTLKGGKFTFTGKLKEPRYFDVMFGKDKGAISVMVENSKIKITAAGTVSKEEGAWITFNDVVITGSKSHDYFVTETAAKRNLNVDYEELHKGSEALTEAYGKARVSENKKAMDSISNSPEYKAYAAKEKAFFDKVEKTTNDLIAKNKATWWGPFFMLTSYTYFTPDQKPIYEQFSDVAKKSHYGQVVYNELNPKTFVGTNVTNFGLNDKDGKSQNLKDIVAGKKYILIDFWASWCGPCRKEIPNLKTAYAEYASKGFEILSISIDKDQKAWQKALGQENMQWHNLLDDDKVSNVFKVKTIPATFLMDSNGVIVGENLRGEELEAKLKELMKS